MIPLLYQAIIGGRVHNPLTWWILIAASCLIDFDQLRRKVKSVRSQTQDKCHLTLLALPHTLSLSPSGARLQPAFLQPGFYITQPPGLCWSLNLLAWAASLSGWLLSCSFSLSALMVWFSLTAMFSLDSSLCLLSPFISPYSKSGNVLLLFHLVWRMCTASLSLSGTEKNISYKT